MFQNSVLPTTAELPHGLPHAGLTQTLRRMTRDVPLPQTMREYFVWVLMMVFVGGLVTVQIWVSMKITEAEQTVVELTDAYTLIEQENAELLWQISQFTNLERIEIEATRMGYAPSLNREYRWVQPDLLLSAPATIPEEGATEVAGQSAPMDYTDTTASSQLPWYGIYWQEIQTWWQPDDAAIGAIWQQ